jgi:hypothetical protein
VAGVVLSLVSILVRGLLLLFGTVTPGSLFLKFSKKGMRIEVGEDGEARAEESIGTLSRGGCGACLLEGDGERTRPGDWG